MEDIYEYIRHPRAAELRANKPVKTADIRRVNHKNPFVRFNARVGLTITLVVGRCGPPSSSRFSPSSRCPRRFSKVRTSLSSRYLHLVLLPIIIVGQNIQAAAADKRSEDTYQDAEAVLKEAEEIQKHVLAQDRAISDSVTRLEKLMGLTPSA